MRRLALCLHFVKYLSADYGFVGVRDAYPFGRRDGELLAVHRAGLTLNHIADIYSIRKKLLDIARFPVFRTEQLFAFIIAFCEVAAARGRYAVRDKTAGNLVRYNALSRPLEDLTHYRRGFGIDYEPVAVFRVFHVAVGSKTAYETPVSDILPLYGFTLTADVQRVCFAD
jgi:hypothetical protein